ncbi:MAG: hypothetical protein JEY99_18995 [Spirochaetales bacterium]|nr:hypothetical protein [Spirochaetales bacterium]
MPYLKIQTNIRIPESRKTDFLLNSSRLLAKELNKPEDSVMTVLVPVKDMVFAGTSEPSAFLEVKSIGLDSEEPARLFSVLSSFLESELGIKKERIYIEFFNAPASMWGWTIEKSSDLRVKK